MIAELHNQREQSHDSNRNQIKQKVDFYNFSVSKLQNQQANIDNKLVKDMKTQAEQMQMVNQAFQNTIYYTNKLESEGCITSKEASNVRARAGRESDKFKRKINKPGFKFTEQHADEMINLPFEIYKQKCEFYFFLFFCFLLLYYVFFCFLCDFQTHTVTNKHTHIKP